MDSFATTTSLRNHQLLFISNLPKQKKFSSRVSKASLLKSSSSESKSLSIAHRIKTIAAGAIVLSASTASLLSGRLPLALAEPPTSSQTVEISPLRSLLYKKLDEGEDAEALSILRRLLAAQPEEAEWKFMAARLLNEMGQVAESRKLFEEILTVDPFSFEALFENAVLMDRCGEGDAVIKRLERALELAQSEQKEAAARDVRLIMAQIQYLQRKVEEALSTYEELAREDPKDYRPYFCQGVIYSLIDRNKEAREKFAKYEELSEKKAEVNAYLQTPLSRVRLFGTGDSEI